MSVFEEELPKPGRKFDERFVITRKLGEGGVGIVFLAHHEELDRDVAIKFLKPLIYADDEGLKRFEREAMTISTLQHPNIATFHSYGVWSGLAYYAMEFVQGKSLHQIVTESGALGGEKFTGFAMQLCSALEYAHEHGVIHRDLKPSNILVSESGVVKIIDFGLAKFLPEDGVEFERLTQTGVMVGTAMYASPEQCLGQQPDRRSDIYGIGCIFHEMLAGCPPFQADNNMALMYKHLHEAPPPLASAPAQVQEIINRALAKDPGKRFQSAGQLKEELERVVWHSQIVKTPAPRARAMLPVWLAAAAVLALGTLVVLMTWLGSGASGGKRAAVDPTYYLRQDLQSFYSTAADLVRHSRYHEALAVIEKGEPVAAKASGSLLQAEYLITKASYQSQAQRWKDALATYLRVEKIFQKHDLQSQLVVVQMAKAHVYVYMHDLERALKLSDDAWSKAGLVSAGQQQQVQTGRAYILRQDAMRLANEGKVQAAQAQLTKALAAMSACQGQITERAHVYMTQADILYDQKDYNQAKPLYQKAGAIIHTNCGRLDKDWCRIAERQINCMKNLGQWDEIARSIDSLIDNSVVRGDPQFTASLRDIKAEALHKSGAKPGFMKRS